MEHSFTTKPEFIRPENKLSIHAGVLDPYFHFSTSEFHILKRKVAKQLRWSDVLLSPGCCDAPALLSPPSLLVQLLSFLASRTHRSQQQQVLFLLKFINFSNFLVLSFNDFDLSKCQGFVLLIRLILFRLILILWFVCYKP